MYYRHHVTLCSCGQPFYGTNFKKHASKPGHEKSRRLYYCMAHNVIGEEGHGFPHKSCEQFAPSKEDMLVILQGRTPDDVPRKLQEAREKKVERERRAAERKVAKEETAAKVETAKEETAKEETAAKEEMAAKAETAKVEEEAEVSEDEEQRRAVEAIVDINEKRKREVLAELFGADVIPATPKRRRVELDSVDLDAEEESEEEEVATSSPVGTVLPPLPPPPTSPIKKTVMFPRQEAVPINPEFEFRRLKNKISRLEKALEKSNFDAALFKGKYEDLQKIRSEEKTRKEEVEGMRAKVEDSERRVKKAELEVELSGKRLAVFEKELMECEEEKMKVEERLVRLMEEGDEEKAKLRVKVREAEDSLVKEKEARKEQDVEMRKFSQELKDLLHHREEQLSVVSQELMTPCNFMLHLELPKGVKIGRRHCDEGADSTMQCYLSPDSNCVHVNITGHDIYAKVRNVEWKGPGKLNTCNNS